MDWYCQKKSNSRKGVALHNCFERNDHELRSSFALCALRLLLERFKRPSTEGFTKYAFARNSFKTPARSYFFLKRFSILSIDSLSFICTLTNVIHPLLKDQRLSFSLIRSVTLSELFPFAEFICTFSRSCFLPLLQNSTIMTKAPLPVACFSLTTPTSPSAL